MSDDFSVERFECDTSLDEIRERFLNIEGNEESCSFCRCYDNN